MSLGHSIFPNGLPEFLSQPEDWREALMVHSDSWRIAAQLGEETIREVRERLVFDVDEAVKIDSRVDISEMKGPRKRSKDPTYQHTTLIAYLDHAKRLIIEGGILDLPEVIRSVRGWSLGNPIPLTYRKRKVRDYGYRHLMCGCDFKHPYLHSLVIQWFHWDGPISRHPKKPQEAVQWCEDMGFPNPKLPSVQARYPRTVRPPVVVNAEGTWHWSIEHRAGGYFSYNPPHIERMGKWEECDVLGVVTLFGDIAVHERGFRSEGLRIEKLWVMKEAQLKHRQSTLRGFLEDTYRCDVVFLEKLNFSGFKDWFKKEDVENLL